MSQIPGGNEMNRHMAGVAPSSSRGNSEGAGDVYGRVSQVQGRLAQGTRSDPLKAMLIAGSIGYGLGWLTALSRSSRREPLPDYARKRA